MQFGAFHGQTFKWVLENALGYTPRLADSMRNETVTSSALSQNKASCKAYAELFPKCREVIAKKRQERLNKAKDQEQTSRTATPASRPSTTGRATGIVRSSTAAAVAPLLHRNASPQQISAAISRSLASRLPKTDHAWVSKALFKANAGTGKPELDTTRYITD